MGIVLPLVIGLIVLAIGAGFFTRKARTAERAQVADRRVTSYLAAIRREASNEELAVMSDVELKDLLVSSIYNLRVQAERKAMALIVGALVTLGVAIGVGTQDGVRGFVIALAVGAVALYGLNEFLVRRMHRPLLRMGLDPDRLRVE